MNQRKALDKDNWVYRPGAAATVEPAPIDSAAAGDAFGAGLRSILGRIPRMRTYSVEKAREEGGNLENARLRQRNMYQEIHGRGGGGGGGVGCSEGLEDDPDSAFVGGGAYLDPAADPEDLAPLPRPPPAPEQDLAKRGEALGIKYFLVSYAPLNTDSRVAVVPRRAIVDVQRGGCGVPAAMFFHADGADPEMYVLPDPASLIQLPWKPEYGWLARQVVCSSSLYLYLCIFPDFIQIRMCIEVKVKVFVYHPDIYAIFIRLHLLHGEESVKQLQLSIQP